MLRAVRVDRAWAAGLRAADAGLRPIEVEVAVVHLSRTAVPEDLAVACQVACAYPTPVRTLTVRGQRPRTAAGASTHNPTPPTTAAMAESDFTPAQTEKLTMLTGLGLPEAQAKKSVATDAAGAPAAACPCSCYW